MASVAQFSFAPPTAAPLSLYTPLSAGGLTGRDSARPGPLPTAFGWVLQRVLSLVTSTASTTGFKWLSLGNISPRTTNLPATPTSEYHPESTSTLITTGNCSLAFSVIPIFVLFVSLLFGAGMVHFGRRGRSPKSPFTGYRQRAKPSPRSPYAESPTLFHQDDTVLQLASSMPRLAFFCALSFALRGLAFLFRLIAVEKLLDMVEDDVTDHEATTSTDNHIAELRVLNRRLGHAMNFATPTPTRTPARLPDANKTLIAPFTTARAKSKLGRVFLPSSDDKVDVILVPEEAPTAPTVADVFEDIIDPLAVDHPGATSVASFDDGDGMAPSLPTSTRRSSFRNQPTSFPNTVIAPLSVEPSGVPDMPSTFPPLYKSSYQPFRRIHVEPPSTPPRNTTTLPPSGIPERIVAREPRAESSSQAELRRIFQRCLEDSPQRQRYSRPCATPGVPRLSAGCQAEVQRIFQPFFDDPRLQPANSKSITPTSSVHPLDPPLEIDSSRRSVKQDKHPNTPPRKDVTVLHRSPEDFPLPLTQDRSAIEVNPVTNARLKSMRERLTLGKLLSSRLSPEADPRLCTTIPQKDVTSTWSASAEANRPQDQAQPSPLKIIPKNTDAAEKHTNLVESEVRERAVKMERARGAIDLLNCTKHPPRASQSGEQVRRPKRKSTDSAVDQETPRVKASWETILQIRQRHEDLFARVQATLKRCDERRELRANALSRHSQGSQEVQASPGGKRAVDTPPSKCLSLTEPEEIGLDGHMSQDPEEVPTTIQPSPGHGCPISTPPSEYHALANPVESQEVPSTETSSSRVLSTPPSQFRPATSEDWDAEARLHSLLELVFPVSDDGPETGSAEDKGEESFSTIEQTSWSFEGYVRPPPYKKTCETGTAERSASPVEPSWRLEDHIPEATSDESWSDDGDSLRADDLDAEDEASTQSRYGGQAQCLPSTPIRLQASRSFSESSCSRLHSPIDKDDQPQKIHDLFYSPTFAQEPSTPKGLSPQDTHFFNGERLTGFGIGSPSSRRIQKFDPRDTFYTSTPRVNNAQFGGFCTSTPRRDVDNRRDTWTDFF